MTVDLASMWTAEKKARLKASPDFEKLAAVLDTALLEWSVKAGGPVRVPDICDAMRNLGADRTFWNRVEATYIEKHNSALVALIREVMDYDKEST